MNAPLPSAAVDYATLTDDGLLARMRSRDPAAFRQLMLRNNQRMFRAARAFMRSDAEAEDVVQEAYLRAFEALARFRGDSSLSTWLTRIVVNEARQRLRDRKHEVDVATLEHERPAAVVLPFPAPEEPSAVIARAQLRGLLERAIGELAPDFRAVFMLRDVEGYTVEQTSGLLGVRPETVKTRLHRARRKLRTLLAEHLSASLDDVFHFAGTRCARISERVMASPRLVAVLASDDRMPGQT